MKKRRIKKSVIITIYILFLILIGFALFLMFGKKKEIKEEPKKEPEVIKEVWPKEYNLSMVTTGDALIHSSLYREAKLEDDTYDFCKMMTRVKPLIEKHDLAFYNQESIIGGKNLGLSTYPRFNSPDEIGDCMVEMGFNVVALANNHTMDKGETGVLYSTKYWKTKDVLTAGSYSSFEDRNEIRIKEKNNITYTLLSYTTVTNGLLPPNGKEYLTNIYSKEKAKEDIDRLKGKVDIIMVSMHWGNEYASTPHSTQVEIAKYLSELGVNVIIGHHPHVLEPITRINDTLVIYSLGNYISAQIGIDRLTGALVSFNIKKVLNEDKSSTITIDNVKGDLIYTKYTNFRDYNLLPYTELNNTILPNYKTHYERNKNILTKLDQTIEITPLP